MKPEIWLDMADIYGDLGQNTEVKTHFTTLLNHLNSHGVSVTLQAYLDQQL